MVIVISLIIIIIEILKKYKIVSHVLCGFFVLSKGEHIAFMYPFFNWILLQHI